MTYGPNEEFTVGGSKVLRQSADDAATVVGVGVTVFEALHAFDALAKEGIAIRVIDAYSVQPIDADTLTAAARATSGRVVTVEDHYAAGGLGDAVASAIAPAGYVVHRLAVREIPRSGKPEELLEHFGVGAANIVAAVKSMVKSMTDVNHRDTKTQKTHRAFDLGGNASNEPNPNKRSLCVFRVFVSLWLTSRHRRPTSRTRAASPYCASILSKCSTILSRRLRIGLGPSKSHLPRPALIVASSSALSFS